MPYTRKLRPCDFQAIRNDPRLYKIIAHAYGVSESTIKLIRTGRYTETHRVLNASSINAFLCFGA